MDSFKKLPECKLPDRREFYSSLKINVIEKHYLHAIHV